jgi:hypothetical protein
MKTFAKSIGLSWYL